MRQADSNHKAERSAIRGIQCGCWSTRAAPALVRLPEKFASTICQIQPSRDPRSQLPNLTASYGGGYNLSAHANLPYGGGFADAPGPAGECSVCLRQATQRPLCATPSRQRMTSQAMSIACVSGSQAAKGRHARLRVSASQTVLLFSSHVLLACMCLARWGQINILQRLLGRSDPCHDCRGGLQRHTP